MNKRKCLTTSLLGGAMGLAALMFLGASPVSAGHFEELSVHHTNYGVAQFNYGNLAARNIDDFTPLIKLMNPVHVTQVAAVIVYEAARGFRPGTAGAYSTCLVRELTPHGSLGLPEAVVNPPGRRVAKYAEVIWAPVDPVSDDDDDDNIDDLTRLADGLGGYWEHGAGNHEGKPELALPHLFSLPSDAVVLGQRQAAIDCVLAGLAALGLSPDIFSDFGIPMSIDDDD